MVAIADRKTKVKVGDRVGFQFGSEYASGTVIEYRGPLAPERRDVFRIRFRFSEGDDMEVELVEDQFEKLAPSVPKGK